jgi:hypothetical protein
MRVVELLAGVAGTTCTNADASLSSHAFHEDAYGTRSIEIVGAGESVDADEGMVRISRRLPVRRPA